MTITFKNKVTMRKVVIIILSIFAFVTNSCGQTNNKTVEQTTEKQSEMTRGNKELWLSPKNMTPLSFIETVRKKINAEDLNVITMFNDFPDNWIKREDIDSLIKFVKSEKKCYCFLNPRSSFIPSDSATIGGYVIKLITAYQQGKRVTFGLYSCPKTNEVEADNIIKWWTEQK